MAAPVTNLEPSITATTGIELIDFLEPTSSTSAKPKKKKKAPVKSKEPPRRSPRLQAKKLGCVWYCCCWSLWALYWYLTKWLFRFRCFRIHHCFKPCFKTCHSQYCVILFITTIYLWITSWFGTYSGAYCYWYLSTNSYTIHILYQVILNRITSFESHKSWL